MLMMIPWNVDIIIYKSGHYTVYLIPARLLCMEFRNRLCPVPGTVYQCTWYSAVQSLAPLAPNWGKIISDRGGDNKLSGDKELNCQWSDKHQPLTVDTDLFWQIIWQTSTKKQGARPVEIDKNRVKVDCWHHKLCHKFCFRKTILSFVQLVCRKTKS